MTKSAGGTVSDRSPMQTFFLARLQHLMEQRGRYATLVGPEDWRSKLIARALYSSYRDLDDLGLAEEARRILERGRVPHRN
jgi:hypothetical protein